MCAHPFGEIGRERKLAAFVGGHLGLGRMGAGDDGVDLAQALEAQHLAGEHEGVAGGELLDEIFLDLAEHAPAGEHACRLERAAFQPREAHAQHRRLDDGADIEPVLLRDARMGDAVSALLGPLQLRVAVVVRERIAAGRDERDDLIEALAGRAPDRARRSSLRDRADRDRTAPRRPCRACAGRARRARRGAMAGCPARPLPAPRAPPGIPSPRSGWPAPAAPCSARRAGDWRGRCAGPSRLAPFGAPTLMTRSTSPQSMPRSSVEVQTTARSLPATIAASTLRRCATSSEP